MKMVSLLSAIINMSPSDLEVLANNLQFYAPSKAERLEFLLNVAQREGQLSKADFERLEKYSDAQEVVR